MRKFPWSDEVWRPGGAAEHAARTGEVWAVRLAVDPVDALEAVWASLAETLTAEADRLLDGGASLRRLDGQIEVVSGGEDALDSLSYCINMTLAEAARSAAASLRPVGEGKPAGGER